MTVSRNLMAILRGITPQDAPQIAEAILEAGIKRIEVPLNSPDALKSIEVIAKQFGDDGQFGAGTVLSKHEANAVCSAGGEFIVSPNCDLEVIRETKKIGLLSYAGVFTATEVFAALGAGADVLKIFPARIITAKGLRDLRAVLPSETEIFAVGGIEIKGFEDWLKAGANGFGIGSQLFKAGDGVQGVSQKAKEIVQSYDLAMTMCGVETSL